MNRMTILGRLADTAKLKHTAQGTAILELRVIDSKRVGETWSNQEFAVTVWAALAERIAPLCLKGREIVAMGEYDVRGKSSALTASYCRVCMTAEGEG